MIALSEADTSVVLRLQRKTLDGLLSSYAHCYDGDAASEMAVLRFQSRL